MSRGAHPPDLHGVRGDRRQQLRRGADTRTGRGISPRSPLHAISRPAPPARRAECRSAAGALAAARVHRPRLRRDGRLARAARRASRRGRARGRGRRRPGYGGRGRSGRGVRVQVPRSPSGWASRAPVRPDRQPARRARGFRPRQRLPSRALLRRRRAVRRSPPDRCPRRLRALGRGPARLRRRPSGRSSASGSRAAPTSVASGPSSRAGRPGGRRRRCSRPRSPASGRRRQRSAQRAPPAFGSARAAPQRCSPASSRGSRARRRVTPAQSGCRLRPSNLRTPDGDVLDAVPGLQGLVRRRTGDPRAAARGRAPGGRRGRGDPGRQHLLRHARGGVEVASGRCARRPVGADGLRDRLCLEPRRRVRERRPERRRHRAGRGTRRPRSSPGTSVRSAASTRSTGSNGSARS